METEQKLISKKALLARYGISYGSLYRWKRKGLIPDEWFIRKTTVTGQETFFPEDLVCERMELILSAKDDVLLDELAERITGESNTEPSLTLETAYGTRVLRIPDIRRISRTDKEGNETDITDIIINLIKEGK